MGKKKGSRSRLSDDHLSMPSSSSNLGKTVTFDGKVPSYKKNGGSKTNGSNDYFMKPSGKGLHASPSVNTLNRLERQNIVLWKRPIQTTYFAARELTQLFIESLFYLLRHFVAVILLTALSGGIYWACNVPGRHQPYIKLFQAHAFTCFSWIGLGILSSVGLGFGLHTFILYLGPFIAQVTVAAHVCQSVDFPEPPYPHEIVCPDMENGNGGNIVKQTAITMWAIMSKVRLEALCWGAGTALGELPPYFMAKAARLSGEEPDDEEYREYTAYMKAVEKSKKPSVWKRIKLKLENFMTGLIDKVGFFGILLCASIPNPLFDLAGITCGYLLIPFWTFFGATLIGKAIIKMHIQMLAVVLAFSDLHVETLLEYIGTIPFLGAPSQSCLRDFFDSQKRKLKNKHAPQSTHFLQQLFTGLIFVMIIYFVLSIVNSLAQRWHKRLCDADKKKKMV